MPRSPNVPCAACGTLIWPSKTRPPRQWCRPCRVRLGMSAFGPGPRVTVHGTTNAYRRHGCRCEECRAAVAAKGRLYAARFAAREGASLSRKYRRPGSEDQFISRADRLAIYERDGWICQLCGLPVDRTLTGRDRMGATLDHIEPRTAVLIPDHSPSNLRLAHRSCNSSRGNRHVVGERGRP